MSYNLLQDDIGACETVHKINWKCFILKICTIVFHSIIIFTGIFVGIYLSTLLMFLASGSLNSRFLGYFTQLLVFIGFNGLFLYFIFQILYEKAIKKSILYSYIISQALYIIMLPIFLFVFYLPAPKSPEFTNEPSGYWLLETGSNISYYEYGQITSEKMMSAYQELLEIAKDDPPHDSYNFIVSNVFAFYIPRKKPRYKCGTMMNSFAISGNYSFWKWSDPAFVNEPLSVLEDVCFSTRESNS